MDVSLQLSIFVQNCIGNILYKSDSPLKGLDEKSQHETTGIPLLWATRLLNKAFEDKKINIESSFVIYNLQGSFMEMEAKNRAILNYGWMNFPLAYTQVVTFTVYFYFFSKLFSDQYLIPDKSLWSEHANVTNVSYVDSGKEIQGNLVLS